MIANAQISNFNNKLQKVIILTNPGSVRHFLVNSIILENVFCFYLVLGSSQPKLGTQMGPILLLQFFLLFPSLLLQSSHFLVWKHVFFINLELLIVLNVKPLGTRNSNQNMMVKQYKEVGLREWWAYVSFGFLLVVIGEPDI